MVSLAHSRPSTSRLSKSLIVPVLLVVFAIFILVLLFRPQGLFGGSRGR